MTVLAFDSLELTNFKSYLGTHKFQLRRNAGLYYIAGRNKLDPDLGANGVGKSTLFDALYWVLTGKTIRDNRPANATVPWSLDRGTSEVHLRFFRGRDEYKLIRTRRPNELRLQSYLPNTLRTVTQDEVTKLVGINEETFRRTVILGQFGTLFLDLVPEQQSRMFNEALGLDLWLRASKAAKDEQTAKESEARQAWGGVTALKGRLAEADQTLTQQQKQADDCESDRAGRKKGWRAELAEGRELQRKLLAENANDGERRPSKEGGAAEALGKRMETLRAALKKAAESYRALDLEATTAGRAKAAAKTEATQYERAIEGNRQCPACGQKASVEHLREKLKAARAAMAQHNSTFLTATEEADKVATVVRGLESQEKKLVRALDAVRDLERSCAGLEERIHELANQSNPHLDTIKTLKARIIKLQEQAGELQTKAEGLEAAAGVCAFWVDAFKTIRLNLIDRTLSELEIAVTRHAEALGLDGWVIKFQTERESKSGNVSAVFTTLLYPPGQEESVRWESYSGGESQRWQLAVAFGLSEVLLARTGVEPTIEVLDEPTKGLSEEGVQDLMEHLADRARELGRAVYVVEHHSLERGLFADTIMIEKDRKGSHIRE